MTPKRMQKSEICFIRLTTLSIMSMPTIVKGEYGIRLTKKAQALLPAFDLGRKKSTAPQNSAFVVIHPRFELGTP